MLRVHPQVEMGLFIHSADFHWSRCCFLVAITISRLSIYFAKLKSGKSLIKHEWTRFSSVLTLHKFFKCIVTKHSSRKVQNTLRALEHHMKGKIDTAFIFFNRRIIFLGNLKRLKCKFFLVFYCLHKCSNYFTQLLQRSQKVELLRSDTIHVLIKGI